MKKQPILMQPIEYVEENNLIFLTKWIPETEFFLALRIYNRIKKDPQRQVAMIRRGKSPESFAVAVNSVAKGKYLPWELKAPR